MSHPVIVISCRRRRAGITLSAIAGWRRGDLW